MTETTAPTTPTDEAAGRVKRWLIAHPGRAAAARFPIDELWTLLDEHSEITALRERYTSLRVAFDGVCGERDQLGRQLDAAEAQPADREQLLTLIDALTDDSDCWFDHNGMCQGHGVPLDPGQRCPHAEAKELLATRPGPLESAVTEARADLAATLADPEPVPPAPPWLVPAGDD